MRTSAHGGAPIGVSLYTFWVYVSIKRFSGSWRCLFTPAPRERQAASRLQQLRSPRPPRGAGAPQQPRRTGAKGREGWRDGGRDGGRARRLLSPQKAVLLGSPIPGGCVPPPQGGSAKSGGVCSLVMPSRSCCSSCRVIPKCSPHLVALLCRHK